MACRRALAAAAAALSSSSARVVGPTAAGPAAALTASRSGRAAHTSRTLAGVQANAWRRTGAAAAVAGPHGATFSAFAPLRAHSTTAAADHHPPPVVLTSRDGPAAILTLNRPGALNALNKATMHALLTAAAQADADPGVRAIIITGGAGGGGGHAAFAAGADVKELASHTYRSAVDSRLLDAWRALAHVRTPLIAAVEGFALGGGCELAAACDVVVAGESAVFGQPEVSLGVVPGMGATQRLPRAVGKALAMDLMLTGRRLSATEAASAGLVSRVVPAGGALAEAKAVAAAIASSPPGAVAKAKQLTNAAFEMPLGAGLETELRDFWACFGTEEQVEGMGNFLAGRSGKKK